MGFYRLLGTEGTNSQLKQSGLVRYRLSEPSVPTDRPPDRDATRRGRGEVGADVVLASSGHAGRSALLLLCRGAALPADTRLGEGR